MLFELTDEQVKVMNDNRDIAKAIYLVNKQQGGDDTVASLADLYVDLVDKIKKGKKDV